MTQRRQHASRVSHERWLVSYADFITLLFAFFVVMYAFAKAGERKQAQVSQAIDTAFRSMGMFHDHPGEHAKLIDGCTSGADTTASPQPVMEEDLESPAKVRDDLWRIRRELSNRLQDEMQSGSVSISMGKDGLVISLREAGFFDSGSAKPHPRTREVLAAIGDALADTKMDMHVEGHTDTVPIHNAQFDSNWELSTTRATSIARMLLDMRAVPPGNLSAAGYSEYHPVATNQTAEGRAQNRRVDLVIAPRTKIDFSLAAPLGSSNGPWRRITDP